jgi:ankyrin repeat protein
VHKILRITRNWLNYEASLLIIYFLKEKLMKLNKNLFFICAGLSANLLYAGQADLRLMEKYLNEGGDPNQRAPYVEKYGLQHTALPLHKAAEWGNEKLVELALQKGANVNAEDHNYWTPLKWAAQGNHKEISEILIKNGANIKGEIGINLLEIVIDYEALEVLKVLVANKILINVDLIGTSHSPLSLAANHGHRKIVKLLLQNGADINYMIETSCGKVTPLLVAIDGACPYPYANENDDEDMILRYTKIACKLLHHGADVNLNDGVNLLERAYGNYRIMEALLFWHSMVPTDKVFEQIASDKIKLAELMKENNSFKKELKRLQKLEILANLNVKNNLLEKVTAVQQEQIALLKERAELLRVEKIASLTDKNN